jgi:hypothetical protein
MLAISVRGLDENITARRLSNRGGESISFGTDITLAKSSLQERFSLIAAAISWRPVMVEPVI